MFARLAAALLLALSMGAGPVLAASGTAVGVKPQAEADTSGEVRRLTVGADIFIGDLVKTGAAGQVQIKFSDNTELVVGPNSALMIEDYLLRDDQSAGKFAINALSGAFRFATGDADKDKYIIKTPTGTIGVRGTAFDFNVLDEGTKVLLYHGEVIMCTLDKTCVTLDGTCKVGTYDPSEARVIGSTDDIKGQDRRDLRGLFLYAQSQMPLLTEFRVEDALVCFNPALALGPPQDSLVKDDGNDQPFNQPDPCDCGCSERGGYETEHYNEEEDDDECEAE